MALGAGKLDIVRHVFLSGRKPVVKGLLVGLWLAVTAGAGLRQSLKGSPIQLDRASLLLYREPRGVSRWRRSVPLTYKDERRYFVPKRRRQDGGHYDGGRQVCLHSRGRGGFLSGRL